MATSLAVDAADFESYDPELAEMLVGGALGLEDGLTGYLGLRMTDVGPGFATAEIDVRPELVHGFGAVHGGVVAAIVDHVLGSAIFPVVPRGTWPATLEFKLNYLAPVRDGVIKATGTVLTLRRRTAVVQVDVTNGGVPVAVALGTISLNPPQARNDSGDAVATTQGGRAGSGGG